MKLRSFYPGGESGWAQYRYELGRLKPEERARLLVEEMKGLTTRFKGELYRFFEEYLRAQGELSFGEGGNTEFAYKAYLARANLSLTPEKAASRIGCSVETIVGIEIGRLAPSDWEGYFRKLSNEAE